MGDIGELGVPRRRGLDETGLAVSLLPRIMPTVEIEGGPVAKPLKTVGDLRDFYVIKARDGGKDWIPTHVPLHKVTLDIPLNLLDDAVYLGRINSIHLSAVRGGGFFRTDSQQPGDIREMIDLILMGLKKQGITPPKIVVKFANEKADKIVEDYCKLLGVQLERAYKKSPAATPPVTPTPESASDPAKAASFKIPGSKL